MLVVDDGQIAGSDRIHRERIANCFVECPERIEVRQIADVLADVGLTVDNIKLSSRSKLNRTRIHDVTLRVVARRLAIAAIIAITIVGPIVEMFDRWDQTLQDGNDTEANVVVVALCVGVTFAIGPIVVVNRIRALSSTSVMRVVVSHVAPREIASFLGPLPTSSPPTILRV